MKIIRKLLANRLHVYIMRLVFIKINMVSLNQGLYKIALLGLLIAFTFVITP